MDGRKPLIAGNWKMFGLSPDLGELDDLSVKVGAASKAINILICPPATLLGRASFRIQDTDFALGGQDCHADREGAHTGDISAAMLKDAGARFVILGHSERRRDHGETDALVRAKLAAAAAAGLFAIVCVGETLAERQAGQANAVVGAQLAASLPGAPPVGLVIAYEPVWAIGTGLTPTQPEIAEIHGFIRTVLEQRYGAGAAPIRVLYGGSVKPANAREIFATPGVDGALVGGASLKAVDFAAIILAHPAASAATA
jgi:triosephosphate isomerase (TIM)